MPIPKGFKPLHQSPCPYNCEKDGKKVLIVQHEGSPNVGFCPVCKGRVDFTGAAFTKSDKPLDELSNAEDDLWRCLRRIHCSHPDKKSKETPHKCVGTVSLAPDGMHLDCGICGHFRKRPIEGKTEETPLKKDKGVTSEKSIEV